MRKIRMNKKAVIITACIAIPTAIAAAFAPKLLKRAKNRRYNSVSI